MFVVILFVVYGGDKCVVILFVVIILFVIKLFVVYEGDPNMFE